VTGIHQLNFSLTLFFTTMSVDSTSHNSKSTSPRRGRTRSKKTISLPDAPITLPKELAMAVDYHAYMSKHSGKRLSIDEVVQEAIISHIEALSKGGIQLPPTMAEDVAKFKASHPTFQPEPVVDSE
jgi:hypothetical protein